jgi:hypothetical protein
MTQLALQDMIGTKFNLVPYRGSPQMTEPHAVRPDRRRDRPARRLPAEIAPAKLRALAIIGNNRVEHFARRPDAEGGRLNFTAEPWYGLQGPKRNSARDRRPDERGGDRRF